MNKAFNRAFFIVLCATHVDCEVLVAGFLKGLLECYLNCIATPQNANIMHSAKVSVGRVCHGHLPQFKRSAFGICILDRRRDCNGIGRFWFIIQNRSSCPAARNFFNQHDRRGLLCVGQLVPVGQSHLHSSQRFRHDRRATHAASSQSRHSSRTLAVRHRPPLGHRGYRRSTKIFHRKCAVTIPIMSVSAMGSNGPLCG